MKNLLTTLSLTVFILGTGNQADSLTLDSVRVTPDSVWTTTDSTVAFTATAYFDSLIPQDVTFDSTMISWVTTDTPAVLEHGLYVPHMKGVQQIRVTYDGLSDTAYAFVTHGVAVRVELMPATTVVPQGSTAALTAMLYDAYGNGWDYTDSTFFTASPYDSGISINSDEITGIAPGIYGVEGSALGFKDTVVVRVTEQDAQAVTDTGHVTFTIPEVTMDIVKISGQGTITVEAHTNVLPPRAEQLTNPVKTYYEIHSDSTIDSFTTVITFSYMQAEFDSSGIAAETLLQCLRLVDTVWTPVPSTVDTLLNTVSCVTRGFSYWTYGECTGIGECECDMELLSQPSETAYAGSTYVYIPDVYGGSLSGLNIDAPAGIIRTGTAIFWTPEAADAGSYKISLLFTGNCRDTVQTFTLHVVDENEVPVELTSFTAAVGDNGVELRWRTESEQNNLGFDVQRADAADGPFSRINESIIPGGGTATAPREYSWTDMSTAPGDRYYRLTMVDLDGSVEYSDAVAVIISASGMEPVKGNTGKGVRFYPQDGAAVFTTGSFNGRLCPANNNAARITLTNAMGNTIHVFQPHAGNGSGYMLPDNLASGMYVVTVEQGMQVLTGRLLIVR